LIHQKSVYIISMTIYKGAFHGRAVGFYY
jgi:hypothetical protein